MDLKKWLAVWERYPELQPELLDRAAGSWWLSSEAFYDSEPPIRASTNEVVAALIRDKAIWWLVRESREVGGISLCPADEGRCGVILMPPDRFPIDSDPTEALYLAVCKVLEIEP